MNRAPANSSRIPVSRREPPTTSGTFLRGTSGLRTVLAALAVGLVAVGFPSLTHAQSFCPLGAGLTGVDQSSAGWADADGDGDLDVVVTGQDFSHRHTAILYENDVASGNGFLPSSSGLNGVAFGSSDWGDFDGDGDPDLIITGYGTRGPQTALLYENDLAGGGGFILTRSGFTGVGSGVSRWGDFDGDGDPDLLVAGLRAGSYFPPSTTLYENGSGSGIGFRPVGAGLPFLKDGPAAAWGDYNGDGRPDLLLSGADSNGREIAGIYRNDGGGSFTDIRAGLTGLKWAGADWADIDGDSDLDALLIGNDGGRARALVYENRGSGQFTPRGSSGLAGAENGSLDTGDFDGDGDPDLVITGLDRSRGTTTTVYRNDGTGSFTPLGAGVKDVAGGAAEWGDFDGDGDLDLIVTGGDGSGSETAIIYENRPSCNAEPQQPEAQTAGCLSFGDLQAGTRLQVGDRLRSGGFSFQIVGFRQADGSLVNDGIATVRPVRTGNLIFLDNASLKLDLGSGVERLSFTYRNQGGNVNLSVNGDIRNAATLTSLDGAILDGGVEVAVRSTPSGRGFLTLRGSIRELTVGGQELGLDDLCRDCLTFEDLDPDTRLAPGDEIRSAGLELRIGEFELSDGTRVSDGTVRIAPSPGFPGLGNVLFTSNATVQVDLGSMAPALSFSYRDQGGNVNLSVNGDFRNIADLTSLHGRTLAGSVRVTVRTSFSGPDAVTLHGPVERITVGGQEFILDDICILGEGEEVPGEQAFAAGTESSDERRSGECSALP